MLFPAELHAPPWFFLSRVRPEALFQGFAAIFHDALDQLRACGNVVDQSDDLARPDQAVIDMAGLERCETPYLVTVPCDSPQFPDDLVERLAGALDAAGAEIAMAATREDGRLQVQPVFCMMRTSVLESLVRFLHAGERKIAGWARQQRLVEVEFADPAAFANANTLDELRRLAADA